LDEIVNAIPQRADQYEELFTGDDVF